MAVIEFDPIDVTRRPRAPRVPLVTVLAGGYATNVRDTVDIHVATIEGMLA